ncbi:MAG: hypothetical protein DME06_01770 [Candidatus Rokuibacteriota bacterium]|nr:MAG: hypothetical protein DME06_01770 [Candidatus Rokubacteria bacterium]
MDDLAGGCARAVSPGQRSGTVYFPRRRGAGRLRDRARVERTLTVTAPELDLLLYDWLSELIYRKDRDREVFTRVQARVTGEGPFQVRAEARGGPIDPARTLLGADPKAVTLHQFAVVRVNGGWRARVVIDV